MDQTTNQTTVTVIETIEQTPVYVLDGGDRQRLLRASMHLPEISRLLGEVREDIHAVGATSGDEDTIDELERVLDAIADGTLRDAESMLHVMLENAQEPE